MMCASGVATGTVLSVNDLSIGLNYYDIKIRFAVFSGHDNTADLYILADNLQWSANISAWHWKQGVDNWANVALAHSDDNCHLQKQFQQGFDCHFHGWSVTLAMTLFPISFV